MGMDSSLAITVSVEIRRKKNLRSLNPTVMMFSSPNELNDAINVVLLASSVVYTVNAHRKSFPCHLVFVYMCTYVATPQNLGQLCTK